MPLKSAIHRNEPKTVPVMFHVPPSHLHEVPGSDEVNISLLSTSTHQLSNLQDQALNLQYHGPEACLRSEMSHILLLNKFLYKSLPY